jgi:hypothetical protein
MRRLSFVVGAVALTALACSDPSSLLPNAPSAPGVTGVEINGPVSIPPGQSAQLVATIRLADGTSKLPSVGTPLQWFSSNNSVLRVSSTGLATGQQPGEARITLIHGSGPTSRQASREFIVVPDGTYRLVGVVRDAEGLGFVLPGVRLEATPGPAVAMTDSTGHYRLYGVPANAVIQITKNGYVPGSQAVQLTTHTTRDFQLVLSGTRVLIGGTYTLDIDATGVCSGGSNLSAELRRRVYEATVTQNGPLVEVLLTEPRFRLNSINRGNRFIGYADASGITFELEPYYSYYYPYYGPTTYPNVAERLPNGTFLVPEGKAATVVTAAGVSGTISASIYNYDSRFPASNTFMLGYCTAPTARFTMTPR